MRISVDKNDPGYAAYEADRNVIVLLDGDPQRLVVTADEERGVIVRYKVDDRGRPVHDGDRMALDVKVGRVQVLRRAR